MGNECDKVDQSALNDWLFIKFTKFIRYLPIMTLTFDL